MQATRAAALQGGSPALGSARPHGARRASLLQPSRQQLLRCGRGPRQLQPSMRAVVGSTLSGCLGGAPGPLPAAAPASPRHSMIKAAVLTRLQVPGRRRRGGAPCHRRRA